MKWSIERRAAPVERPDEDGRRLLVAGDRGRHRDLAGILASDRCREAAIRQIAVEDDVVRARVRWVPNATARHPARLHGLGIGGDLREAGLHVGQVLAIERVGVEPSRDARRSDDR